jgi:hypothetical protein
MVTYTVKHGLATAVSTLDADRSDGSAIKLLFEQIRTDSQVAHLGDRWRDEPESSDSLAERVRSLERQEYIRATREMMALLNWLKRAVDSQLE